MTISKKALLVLVAITTYATQVSAVNYKPMTVINMYPDSHIQSWVIKGKIAGFSAKVILKNEPDRRQVYEGATWRVDVDQSNVYLEVLKPHRPIFLKYVPAKLIFGKQNLVAVTVEYVERNEHNVANTIWGETPTGLSVQIEANGRWAYVAYRDVIAVDINGEDVVQGARNPGDSMTNDLAVSMWLQEEAKIKRKRNREKGRARYKSRPGYRRPRMGRGRDRRFRRN